MEEYKTEKTYIDSVLHIKTAENNQVLFHLVCSKTDTYYELVEHYKEQRLKYKNQELYITYYFKDNIYRRKKAVLIHKKEQFLKFINELVEIFLNRYKNFILNRSFHFEDNIDLYLRKFVRVKKIKIDIIFIKKLILKKFPNFEILEAYFKIKDF
tara:strand:- start:530 stop:994 length:465 start_codon:yes stop_codon:yes gene_type:complete